MLEGWSTDSCKNLFGQTILSDARAFQSSLKNANIWPFAANCQFMLILGQTYILVSARSRNLFKVEIGK